ncbi:hypothetical protein B296_00054001 [Ensete ventricosum]|uniref:Uncharacterized protein n=1 Tax=Ensete ventricosum TaxID=4639 RepID=A0A426X8D0_ENSVE|nr:hypothetical protein B296_00054001 [Ensete ventricosum]
MAGRVGLTVTAEDVVALRKKTLVTPKEDVGSRSRCQRQLKKVSCRWRHHRADYRGDNSEGKEWQTLSWERQAIDGGKSHREQTMQQEGRKKRQWSGSQLEATAAAIGERYWEGKERLAGDQIRRQHDRDDCCGSGGRGWIATAEAAARWGESSIIVVVLHGRGGVERPSKEEEEQP